MAKSEHLALLRAMARGNFEEQSDLSNALHASGDLDGYGEVIGAAFLLAIRMQFQDRFSPDDVIRLVADTRTMVDVTGDVINPRIAERVVRAALGEEGLLAGAPEGSIVESQIAVCSFLAAEERLGDPDAFVADVKKLLDEWGV
jgi:hypothetical protein